MEPAQARLLGLPQPVLEIITQVGQRPLLERGVAMPDLLRDFRKMRDAGVARLLQRAALRRRRRIGTPDPHRVHERQAGQGFPLRAQVDLGHLVLRRIDLECRIADHERRVGTPQHRFEIGLGGREPRLDLPLLRAQDARERHRGARAQVERERFDTLDRLSGEHGDGRHVTIRGDRNIRHDGVVTAQVFDGRNQPEVDASLVQQLRAFCRDVEAHVELIRMGIEPIHERFRIEIRDRSKSERTHGRLS